MSWWSRLRNRSRLEEQLEKELRFHLEQQESDLAARGRSSAEARREARLALGGPEQVKEKCRDARGTRWAEELLQDASYAFRTSHTRHLARAGTRNACSAWRKPGPVAPAVHHRKRHARILRRSAERRGSTGKRAPIRDALAGEPAARQ